MVTLSDLLSEAAKARPGNLAIVDEERALNYRSLYKDVRLLAHWLDDLGIRRGDPVALLLPNGIEFATSFFSVAELGAIVVPVNTHYKKSEISQILKDCRPKALITLKEFEELCHRAIGELSDQPHLVIVDGAEIRASAMGRNHRCLAETTAVAPYSDDDVLYQFSSGSTGNPKLIARTHFNLVFELNGLARTLSFSDQDRFLGVTPFSHVNGLVRSMLASLSVGATLFTLRNFKRQQVVNTIERAKISVFIGVPSMFGALAETIFPQPTNLTSLRLCISSSAPMPVSANQRFREKYGFYVRQLYGSTETGTVSVNLSEQIQDSLESVGAPIEGVEVSVWRDDHTPVDVAEAGEVVVKSPAAIARYHNSSEGAKSFKDGYFLTSDLGRIDEKGNLYLTGRKKFFINKGGYKINPWEVENILQSHPAVKHVAVIGIPGLYGDERVKAVIVPQHRCTQGEIIEYCSGQIASFKVPSIIEFRESLPTTPSGKIMRSKLK